MTTQLTVSEKINAPVDLIWPWVANLEKHSQWSPKPYKVELVSGEPNSVGSKYRSVGVVPPGDKEQVNDVEISEINQGHKIVFLAHDRNGTFRNTFTFTPVSGGTEVTFNHTFPRMKGIGMILLPLLLPIVGKKDAMKRLGMLKAKAEAKV
jgi:uncharacterized protein YndB with AHSA1/START domain